MDRSRIDKKEWEEAQAWEKNEWLVKCPGAGSDRQMEHFQNFAGYQALYDLDAEKPIKTCIELGCGPFTNIRFIHMQGLFRERMMQLKKIHLLDPLLLEYLDHAFCYYKNKEINNIPCAFHASPIEEFHPPMKYDLVVMINVIEHCYDVAKIIKTVTNCMQKGSILIFHDPIDNPKPPNTGHPLRLNRDTIEDWLSGFNELYRYETEHPTEKPRTDLFFIGTQK